eukprot:2479191-Pyramimonas_sp.AAC.1
MGFPEDVLHAIAELYRDIKVQILFCRPRQAFFRVLRGVEQGCPLSGSIFCLVFDPFIRVMVSRLPRDEACLA